MEIKFKLSGLSCEACVKLAAKKIGRLTGVQSVAIDRDSGQTVVKSDRVLTVVEIRQIFEDTDYRVVIK